MKPQEALDMLKLKTRWLDTSIFNTIGEKPSLDVANNLHRLAEHVMNAAVAYRSVVRETIMAEAKGPHPPPPPA